MLRKNTFAQHVRASPSCFEFEKGREFEALVLVGRNIKNESRPLRSYRLRSDYDDGDLYRRDRLTTWLELTQFERTSAKRKSIIVIQL